MNTFGLGHVLSPFSIFHERSELVAISRFGRAEGPLALVTLYLTILLAAHANISA